MKKLTAVAVLSACLLTAASTLAQHDYDSLPREGSFQGTWIASGERHTLSYPPDREVFTFENQGHVNLEGQVGHIADFWAECLGLWDSDTGGEARCVWRGIRTGTEIYTVLTGQIGREGVEVKGRFVGGTGLAQGIEGEFSFTNASVASGRENGRRTFTSHSTDLKGSYRLP